VKNREREVPLSIPKATAERLHLNELNLPKRISAATITEWLERSQDGPLGGRLRKFLDFWQRLLPGSKWTEEWKAEGGINYPVQDLGPQEPALKPRMDRMTEEERIQTMAKISEMEEKGVLEEVPSNAPTKLWHTKARCWVHEMLNGSFTQAKKDTSKLRLLTDLKRSGGNLRMKAAKFKQDGPNTVKRDDLVDDEMIALYPSPGGEDIAAATTTTNVGLVAKQTGPALKRPTRPRSPSVVCTEAPVYNAEPMTNECAAPVHEATATGAAGAGRMWYSDSTQDRRRALVSSNVPVMGKSTEAERERYRLCLTHSLITVSTLVRCGFLLNVKTCEVEPESLRTWHGFRWCFSTA
jgi:hypothetical protein